MPNDTAPVREDIPSTARFCVNCRWFIPDQMTPRCDAPQTYREVINLVTGKRVRRQEWTQCELHRAHDEPTRCGPQGRWYEPRQIQDAAE